jgi:hypothetical protein
MKSLVSYVLVLYYIFNFSAYSKIHTIYPCVNAEKINPVASYEGVADENLSDVMVPIPTKDRVYNKTGIQCVWASVECLGRYAEEPKLINLTDDAECKGYSSPYSLSNKLKKIKVKFEQTTSRSDKSLILRSVVRERRGCLFGVPGHAMVLVHYDEEKAIVKYINNSDRSLKVRTWTLKEFEQRWDGWICTVYADNDVIPKKYTKIYPIPIIDKIMSQGNYDKNYILQPQLRL